MDNDIVERLDTLHVWPQSVADHHADILTPRQVKELYAVGAVATDAKATIETLAADLARVTAERDDLREGLFDLLKCADVARVLAAEQAPKMPLAPLHWCDQIDEFSAAIKRSRAALGGEQHGG